MPRWRKPGDGDRKAAPADVRTPEQVPSDAPASRNEPVEAPALAIQVPPPPVVARQADVPAPPAVAQAPAEPRGVERGGELEQSLAANEDGGISTMSLVGAQGGLHQTAWIFAEAQRMADGNESEAIAQSVIDRSSIHRSFEPDDFFESLGSLTSYREQGGFDDTPLKGPSSAFSSLSEATNTYPPFGSPQTRGAGGGSPSFDAQPASRTVQRATDAHFSNQAAPPAPSSGLVYQDGAFKVPEPASRAPLQRAVARWTSDFPPTPPAPATTASQTTISRQVDEARSPTTSAAQGSSGGPEPVRPEPGSVGASGEPADLSLATPAIQASAPDPVRFAETPGNSPSPAEQRSPESATSAPPPQATAPPSVVESRSDSSSGPAHTASLKDQPLASIESERPQTHDIARAVADGSTATGPATPEMPLATSAAANAEPITMDSPPSIRRAASPEAATADPEPIKRTVAAAPFGAAAAPNQTAAALPREGEASVSTSGSPAGPLPVTLPAALAEQAPVAAPDSELPLAPAGSPQRASDAISRTAAAEAAPSAPPALNPEAPASGGVSTPPTQTQAVADAIVAKADQPAAPGPAVSSTAEAAQADSATSSAPAAPTVSNEATPALMRTLADVASSDREQIELTLAEPSPPSNLNAATDSDSRAPEASTTNATPTVSRTQPSASARTAISTSQTGTISPATESAATNAPTTVTQIARAVDTVAPIVPAVSPPAELTLQQPSTQTPAAIRRRFDPFRFLRRSSDVTDSLPEPSTYPSRASEVNAAEAARGDNAQAHATDRSVPAAPTVVSQSVAATPEAAELTLVAPIEEPALPDDVAAPEQSMPSGAVPATVHLEPGSSSASPEMLLATAPLATAVTGGPAAAEASSPGGQIARTAAETGSSAAQAPAPANRTEPGAANGQTPVSAQPSIALGSQSTAVDLTLQRSPAGQGGADAQAVPSAGSSERGTPRAVASTSGNASPAAELRLPPAGGPGPSNASADIARSVAESPPSVTATPPTAVARAEGVAADLASLELAVPVAAEDGQSKESRASAPVVQASAGASPTAVTPATLDLAPLGAAPGEPLERSVDTPLQRSTAPSVPKTSATSAIPTPAVQATVGPSLTATSTSLDLAASAPSAATAQSAAEATPSSPRTEAAIQRATAPTEPSAGQTIPTAIATAGGTALAGGSAPLELARQAAVTAIAGDVAARRTPTKVTPTAPSQPGAMPAIVRAVDTTGGGSVPSDMTLSAPAVAGGAVASETDSIARATAFVPANALRPSESGRSFELATAPSVSGPSSNRVSRAVAPLQSTTGATSAGSPIEQPLFNPPGARSEGASATPISASRYVATPESQPQQALQRSPEMPLSIEPNPDAQRSPAVEAFGAITSIQRAEDQLSESSALSESALEEITEHVWQFVRKELRVERERQRGQA